MSKPFVFIGSSSEGLEVAKSIKANLDHSCECQIWCQGLFGLSEGTLESLVNSISMFDFAILALTNDDLLTTRGADYNSPRDNVLFELGMFIGGLGKKRTFIVIDKSAKLKLPSDLAGITPASFEPPQKGKMQSAVGTACYEIEQAISSIGLKKNESINNSEENELEASKLIITNYLSENNYTKVSFERLLIMNSKFERPYIENLINSFPKHFRISLIKGQKPGIALVRKNGS